jgi:hypothetical protein
VSEVSNFKIQPSIKEGQKVDSFAFVKNARWDTGKLGAGQEVGS